MKAAIGKLRQAGRKWFALWNKVIASANFETAWDWIRRFQQSGMMEDMERKAG